MELPFKKGDWVIFKGDPSFIDRFDRRTSYNVIDCYKATGYGSGYAVKINIETIEYKLWDSGWFELDKPSIVKAIIADL
jgi:hypothetical protein